MHALAMQVKVYLAELFGSNARDVDVFFNNPDGMVSPADDTPLLDARPDPRRGIREIMAAGVQVNATTEDELADSLGLGPERQYAQLPSPRHPGRAIQLFRHRGARAR